MLAEHLRHIRLVGEFRSTLHVADCCVLLGQIVWLLSCLLEQVSLALLSPLLLKKAGSSCASNVIVDGQKVLRGPEGGSRLILLRGLVQLQVSEFHRGDVVRRLGELVSRSVEGGIIVCALVRGVLRNHELVILIGLIVDWMIKSARVDRMYPS